MTGRSVYDDETEETEHYKEDSVAPLPQPGVVVVVEQGQPASRVVPLAAGRVMVGRSPTAGVVLTEQGASREHVEIGLDGTQWWALDKGSRNGTYVDGARLERGEHRRIETSVRVEKTVLVVDADLARFRQGEVRTVGGRVEGPWMRVLEKRLGVAAAAGWAVLVTGESGSGKDFLGHAYQRLGRHAGGPFIKMNCAHLQPNIAEATLFGTRKGAFTGALDQKGKFDAAHGGVLFLDEVAEIHPDVQAKLLHVLESGEVVPVGANHGHRVDVLVCAATHADLPAAITARKFRHDLYRRLSRVRVNLPPLRERREEIPFHACLAIDAAYADLPVGHRLRRLAPSVLFHEACLRREWSGNVRELWSAMSEVIIAADEDDHATELQPKHLPADVLASPRRVSPVAALADDDEGDDDEPDAATLGPKGRRSLERLVALLRGNASDVRAAALELGITRRHAYRLLKRGRVALPVD